MCFAWPLISPFWRNVFAAEGWQLCCLKRDDHRTSRGASLGQEKNIILYLQGTSNISQPPMKPCIFSIWASKRTTFSGWLPTLTTFGRHLTTMHRQSMSLRICRTLISFLEFLVILYSDGAWHGEADRKFWKTAHASAGAEASGSESAHHQKNLQACCDGPWLMYGDRSYRQSLSDGAAASHAYWFWRWRHVFIENDSISARNIFKPGFKKGLRHGQNRWGRKRRKAVPPALYKCTDLSYKDCVEKL